MINEKNYSTLEIRIHAVAAVLRGQTKNEVANAFGIDRGTLYRWVNRYKHDGEDGLHRKSGSGRPRKLEELNEEELLAIVLQPASSFGFETDLWTVGRLHHVICERYQADVSKDTIWRRLREAGLTYQKPEREFYEADEKARQKWRRYEVPKIRRAVEKYKAILYFQDESNISLTAFLGKTWSLCGHTPKAKVTGNRGGVSAMSAISGQGHLLFRLHQKRIASSQVIDFLRQMLNHHPRRHLVIVMDRAPPHTSKKTQAYIASQSRLHVFYLPSYSPDWNPDEKVWNHLKHHELKSHQAKTKDELKTLTHKKLKSMSRNQSLVRGLYFRSYVADFFG
jgi:transposase